MLNKTNLTDDDLIKQIKSDFSSDAMQELITRHQDLYYSVCHKYHKKYPSIRLHDLLNDIYIVFNSSVNTYNPNKKTKFSTWMAHMSRFHCLNTNKKFGNFTFLEKDECLDIIMNSADKMMQETNDNDINQHILDIINGFSDERIKKIFYFRFIEGGKKNKVMSFSEISKKLNLSISHVINLYQRGQKILQKKIKK